MNLAEFRETLKQPEPPEGLTLSLQAMWYAAKGDWNRAHELAQADESTTGAWVHAYLHRVEGDPDNAAYWYRRAGQPASTVPLDAEWESVTASLLVR